MTWSMSSGISSCFPAKPTAPTTCMGFIPDHGSFMVASSHNMTPKDHTSAFSSLSSFLSTSGAIHSGVPAFVFELRDVFRLTRDNPKSHTLTMKLLSTRRFGDLRSLCTIIGSNECK